MLYGAIALVFAASLGAGTIVAKHLGWSVRAGFAFGVLSSFAILVTSGAAMYARHAGDQAESDAQLVNSRTSWDSPIALGETLSRRSVRDRAPTIADQRNAEHARIVDVALWAPESAHELSIELLECSDLDRLLDEHKYLSERLDEAQLDAATLNLDEQSKKCLPFLGMHERTAYDLAYHAAQSGVIEAQITFPAIAATYINSSEITSLDENFIRKFKEDSLRFAIRAAATGEPAGLYHAYTVYVDGLFTEPDYRKAHHYLSEYAKRVNKPGLHQELERIRALMK